MSKPKDSQQLASAEALVLKDLVEYQEGAVVSRTITKGPAGNMTLFAFAAGQELSEHSTPFDAYVHVLDGTVALRIGGQDVEAHAGEIVFMPADIPHAVKAVERFKMLLAMLKQTG